MSTSTPLRKFLRFVGIYGVGRAWYKAAGRLRIGVGWQGLWARSPDVGVIGCGQFAFATIGYFIRTAGHRFGACFDTDAKAQANFARALGVEHSAAHAQELLQLAGLRTVFIASNHASHADYAVQALRHGLDTYVEKPIALSHGQLVELLIAKAAAKSRLFAGYNRPFSGAIRELRARAPIDPAQGITLQCFVAGHKLAADHWYRKPEEGTRICGNVGHWLDLLVHILAWRGLPDSLDIHVVWASDDEPDDNACIAIRSDRGDVFSVLLTSRNEPFEGINEAIHFQHGETTCKIDDFRRMVLWQGPRVFKRRFWPKDVGHRDAILQPFSADAGRDWHEVELSTLLTLHIADMVRQRTACSTFSFSKQWAAIESMVAAGCGQAAVARADALQTT